MPIPQVATKTTTTLTWLPKTDAMLPQRLPGTLKPRARRDGIMRTGLLQPDVVAVLRAAQPLHVTPDTFVFTTPTGCHSILTSSSRLPWHRALRATGTRPRKFYATRHTFISVALGEVGSEV